MAALSDLATYPEWLSLVSAAETEGVSHDSELSALPVWQVTLRARLGPLARSKRLRMARTHLDERLVRFERSETDGRDHSAWILEATVTPAPGSDGSDVVVHLHYGGTLWSAPLEIALASFESSAATRLGDWLSTS